MVKYSPDGSYFEAGSPGVLPNSIPIVDAEHVDPALRQTVISFALQFEELAISIFESLLLETT